MAYDEKLADRIRGLHPTSGLTEKKMFGGLCFLWQGHMCFGIVRDTLMVRVGPAAWPAVLDEPHVRPMDFTGKPMKGMIYVAAMGLGESAVLADWTGRGLRYAQSLPPKKAKKPKKPTPR